MAETPRSVLVWDDGCPDCGHREVRLPLPPVPVADDFDWSGRDFEHFRRVMLEELAAADPGRTRWTKSDLEVVLVEALAAALDRTSHAIDVAFHQRFLGTAEWPFAIVRLLAQIDGVDAAAEAIERRLSQREAVRLGFGDPAIPRRDALMAALTGHSELIGFAKAAGLSVVGTTLALSRPDDLVDALRTCPVVSEASAVATLQKGRQTYLVSVLLDPPSLRLHDRAGEVDEPEQTEFRFWYDARDALAVPPGLPEVGAGEIDAGVFAAMTIRTALERAVGPFLPQGADLRLADGRTVGLYLRLCIRAAANRYRSEMDSAVRQALAAFFAPREWPFGRTLFESDLIEALSAIDGVEGVVISRMQMVGRPQSGTALVAPKPDEALRFVFDNPQSGDGYLVLEIRGARTG
jgi:hypothetical protein